MALELVDGWWSSINDWILPDRGEKQQNNVMRIWAYCKMYGWTAQACAGALGNFRWESTFNPSIWQGRPSQPPADVEHTDRGIGLPQWTTTNPAKRQKYTGWCADRGLDYKLGASNMAFLLSEDEHKANWMYIRTVQSQQPKMTWDEYIHSTLSPRTLALKFWWGYEYSEGYEDKRADTAEYWYGVITTTPVPDVPPLPISPPATKVPSWLLFKFNHPKQGKRRIIL